MQTDKLPLWAKITGYFFGIALLFLGARFLFLPETAERGFGLVYDQPSDSFHSIKGIRDLFTGLILIIFTAVNWRKPLMVVVLVGSLIPVVDMLVVLNALHAVPGTEWIHGLTAVASWVFAYFLSRS
ncbi:DUF4267 domain-containing protein [Spirosoma agri]|uniref:DUF4267 domain-containing protein n=1 Tax=Spirosoma agri TaxID=1987381 RepID=A0A6M0IFM4_9BACT|nr:DUF4267 domain-containing protein [Spirosoma agri]NEU66161.1 DUF4267 domain-containing protein [Spirosoma agri]